MLGRAETAALAERREWRALLHYRRAADGQSAVSAATDSRFFLAPEGQSNPRAELAATLRAFFTTTPVGGDPQPAQCAFIGRYQWLKAELRIDDRRLPPQACARFEHWRRELDTEAVTLVFASAYLNNPASLFGHLFLRLDQRGQGETSPLLAYAVNYAADTTDSNPLLYAINGVSGGFKARFALQPYYQLVRTYGDLENRDLWEYRLHLSAAQRRRLLEHVWELRGIDFNYYFFRENCAWQLLTLLEVTDPALRLSDQFPLWTLPADALRLLVRQAGLVGEATARPGRSAKINRRYVALTAREQRLARRLRQDPASAAAPEFRRQAPSRQALLLELALDEHQQSQANTALAGRDPLAHRLLATRNQLAVASTPVQITPYATRPETGHASRRIGLSSGQRNGGGFLEINTRAAYHGLLEPDAGYTPDAGIELLSLALRRYEDHERWALDRLTLLDIASLSPFNALTLQPAWHLYAGWESAPQPDGLAWHTFSARSGVGIAVETGWPWRTVWFALPGLTLDTSAHLVNSYRAGWNLELGLLAQPTPAWKGLARFTRFADQLGSAGPTWRAEVRQHLALDRDLALTLDWRCWGGLNEFAIGLYAYF